MPARRRPRASVPFQLRGPPRLSFAQERLWFLDQLEPGNPFYNVPIALTLKGQLNVAALAGVIGEIVRRHAVLRSSYPAVDGKPTQVIADRLEVRLPVVDLNELPGEARTSEATRRVVDEMRLPFDLAKGPLIRAQLLRLDRDNHILLFTMHHIVSDGWSLGVLIEELVPLYRAGLRATCVADGAAPDSLCGVLPDLPIQYGDFAAWQREWLSGEVLERQLAYWRRQLAGVPPVLELPTDRPRPPAQSYRGSSVRFTVDPATTTALRNLSQEKEAHPVHDAPGRMGRPPLPLQRAERHRDRLAHRESEPARNRAVDRVLRQHPGAAGGSVGQPGL